MRFRRLLRWLWHRNPAVSLRRHALALALVVIVGVAIGLIVTSPSFSGATLAWCVGLALVASTLATILEGS